MDVKTTHAPIHGKEKFSINPFNSSFHSLIIFGRETYRSYKETTMMRITNLNVSEASALETPNTSSITW